MTSDGTGVGNLLGFRVSYRGVVNVLACGLLFVFGSEFLEQVSGSCTAAGGTQVDSELVGYGIGAKIILGGPSGLRAGSVCNWKKGCPECGAGLEIVGPLYLRSADVLKRKTPVCDTADWILMVNGDIYRHALQLDRAVRTSFGEVCDVETKKPIDWYHVKPQFELPLPNLRRSKIKLPSKRYDDLCLTCGRATYGCASSEITYYDKTTWPPDVPVVAKSWEYYGTWSRRAVAERESIGVRPAIVFNPEMGEWLRDKYGKRWFRSYEVRLTGK